MIDGDFLVHVPKPWDGIDPHFLEVHRYQPLILRVGISNLGAVNFWSKLRLLKVKENTSSEELVSLVTPFWETEYERLLAHVLAGMPNNPEDPALDVRYDWEHGWEDFVR